MIGIGERAAGALARCTATNQYLYYMI